MLKGARRDYHSHCENEKKKKKKNDFSEMNTRLLSEKAKLRCSIEI